MHLNLLRDNAIHAAERRGGARRFSSTAIILNFDWTDSPVVNVANAKSTKCDDLSELKPPRDKDYIYLCRSSKKKTIVFQANWHWQQCKIKIYL